jgi:hypothetical protein
MLRQKLIIYYYNSNYRQVFAELEKTIKKFTFVSIWRVVYSLAPILITGLLLMPLLVVSFFLSLVSLVTLMMTAQGQQQPSSNATTAAPSNATIATMLEDPHCLTFREELSVMRFAPVGMEPSEAVATATIDKAYNQVFQGTNGVLGAPTSGYIPSGDGIGYFRQFEKGAIYYSPATCAHAILDVVPNTFLDKYNEMGAERGPLGYPITDTQQNSEGIPYNHFQHGAIYWTGNGVFEVHGAIWEKWNQLGREQSFLKYPTTDELPAHKGDGGRFNFFQGGLIIWHPSTGANEVHGAILQKYAQIDYEKSWLGYPITDELDSIEGFRYNHFQDGTITWSAETGAFERHKHDSEEARFHVRMPDGTLAESCPVAVDIFGPWGTSANVGGTFPTWVNIDDSKKPVILEGEVVPGFNWETWPHVAWQDTPYLHYTHDMTFMVKPDPTPDNQFTNLLPMRHYPEGIREQQSIEVEWETGLAADNFGNPFTPHNIYGNSGGFFSQGHRLGDKLWNWPTIGGHVHIVGNWVWDRGHLPAAAEIHPPRLVAIERNLPVLIDPDTLVGPTAIPTQDGQFRLNSELGFILATKADIFASGDGGALWNNRNYPWYSSFVEKVPMSEMDYTFSINQKLPRPSPNAELRYVIINNPGDTFPVNPIVSVHQDGTPLNPNPHIRVTIPWQSQNIAGTEIFGKTIYLYWNEGLGVPENYKFHVLLFTPNAIHVRDNSDGPDGDWRIFGDIGGQWTFWNDFAISQDQVEEDGILGDGLGDVGDESYPAPGTSPNSRIRESFLVVVPDHRDSEVHRDEQIRIHASGWDADASDNIFGRLFDQNRVCDKGLEEELNDRVFGGNLVGVLGNAFAGCLDDPVGEVNEIFRGDSLSGLHGRGLTLDSHRDLVTERVCGNNEAGTNYSISITVHRVNHNNMP